MLTEDFINQYLVRTPPTHEFYKESLDISKNLKYHAKGHYPAELIEIARPNEETQYKTYRKDVFTAVTKTYFSKVVTTIGKIRRAEDWDIDFKDSNYAKLLSDYTNKNYPYFQSFENWFFTIALTQMCEDPNMVCMFLPLPKQDPKNDAEIYKPFGQLFPCENVIDWKENQYAVLLSDEKSLVQEGQNKVKKGLVYYFIDNDSVTKAVQVGDTEKFTFDISNLGFQISHSVGVVPGFKIGGIIEKFTEGEMLFDSFIGDCIPYWHEAIRRYSDHQVNMVLHLHPDRWEIKDSPCPTCKGSGNIHDHSSDKTITAKCGTCGGGGHIAVKTPFGVKLINPVQRTGPNEAINIPTPPMGNVARDIASISFLKEEYKDDIQDGLAAINLEFLMNEPEINSGVSKSYDRQEMNTYFNNIARHVVQNIFQPSYLYIIKWQYGKIITDAQLLDAMPSITIPTKFDIVSADVIAQRLTTAKTAGLNPALQTALQIEYAESEFGEESDEALMIVTIDELDPLPNLSQEEKMTILSNKGCTQDAYILSCNLPSFINRACNEKADFMELKYAEKLSILNKYVEEIKKTNSANIVPIIDNSGLQAA